jgi:ribosomal protein S20
MPIIKSAKKAARQAEKRTAHNGQIKKAIKAALKAFKANPTAENLSKAQSEYDKAAKKGLIKKNTASRRKANLVKIAKAANVKPAAKKAVKAEKPAAKPATKAAAKPAAKKATAAKAPAKKAATAKKPAAKKTTKKEA